MNDSATPDLHSFLALGWDRLRAGVAEPTAAARTMTLATTGLSGWPQARTVVLRGADQASGLLTVHTDGASEKVAEIRMDQRATMLVWDDEVNLQIRLRVEVEERPRKYLAKLWERIPDSARRVYGGAPYPGYAIASPQDHHTDGDFGRFAVLDCAVVEVELLRITPTRHFRAVYRVSEGFKGTWLAP
ncbi:MAG: pyridoxamine 5'-phosphate oxidase family protein [Pseudomonadota bacterium]|nr:pyridoxamine 5'-phosphate oxidase family protein [Pseudomonadota bacterium]MEE3070545.1 pyridoxamine 5'-phosphate oxidase family protein [Pseudomonadota bacterium]